MEQTASYLAPAATMIAAMMTAANLGARVTGWGFVVFTVGSICWSIIGITSGQQNLLLTNAFLTFVNLVGVWRWLGRQAKYSDGSRHAARRSERAPGPALVSASALANAPVTDEAGDRVASVVDAMLSRDDGRIIYLVVSRGGVAGVGAQLHPLDPAVVELTGAAVVTKLSSDQIGALPVLEVDQWPSELPRTARFRPAGRAGGLRAY